MSTLSISIVQTHIDWENKSANLYRLGEKIRNISEKTEIVILPEMFSTGFSLNPESLAEDMDGATIGWMKSLAAERKAIITGSIIIKEKIEKDYHYFNRLVWMLPTGEWGFYDKRHLFAFAGEDDKFTSGNRRLIASVKGWKINLLVCYDLRFPVWSRQQIKPGEDPDQQEFDLLVYVANWPERRIHAWKTLLQARAIENLCYVIGVNRIGDDGNKIIYNGNSMIVDPLGEILHQSSNAEEVFTYHLQKDKLGEIRSRFPFWRDADHFLIEP